MKKTEIGTETNIGTESKTENRIIGTTELSEIVSEKIGRIIEPKRLRSILRNDETLSDTFDDGLYTKYRFSYPSKIVDRIIDRIRNIESGRIDRTEKSKNRRTERKNRIESNVYNDVDENGKPIFVPVSENGNGRNE